ncbi:MAG: transcription termination/antitermination protein NusA [Mogibacterium sp.]|nr:transcription termination/antitermination protein NusA [Mogibacterium sp.]
MSKEFLDAFADLKKEKNLSQEEIIGAIKDSIENAYRKNYGASNVRVEVDMEEGNVTVFMGLEVVEEVEDDLTQISLEEAKEIYDGYELGDVVEYEIDPKDFNRIAAQGAKQVFVQKNREAERTNSYNEFIEKKGQIVTGKVERINNGTMLISLGRTEGRVPASEQVRTESFKPGDRIKVYVMDVKKENKGPQVLLSRSHPGLVRGLFELEIPEIADGTVEIRGTAREAGSRTKIAVFSNDPNVDPVGACVGNRGARVQNIADELFGEKIDIIVWDDDPAVLISNVLRPAIVEGVYINEDEKAATAVVPEQQLSLAIGREGQNVRLAARVSGWKIDIKSHEQLEEMGFAFDEYEDSEDIEEIAEETSDIAEDAEGAAEDIAEETAETEEVGAVEETSDSEADA